MKFVRIELLFLIWIIPVLLGVIAYGIRRRRALLATFSTDKGLAAIVPGLRPGRRWIKALMLMGCSLALILALAGPQYGYQWQEIEIKGVDIIIALDVSKSMLATDIQPTRLDRAKREVFDLLEMLRGDRIGLVAFAGTAFLQCPLTADYSAFYLFLDALTPDFMPVGGSDIAGAVQVAMEGFNAESNSEKAIILITDGQSTGSDPVKAAQSAAEAGVKLFCIGVGRGDGVPIPGETGGFKKDAAGKIILTQLDEPTLKKMAAMTKGAYVPSVAGDMDLEVIYSEEIRGKLEATTQQGGRKQVWQDRYQWFLGLAILFLLAEMFWPVIVPKAGMMALMLVLTCPLIASAGAIHDGLAAYEQEDYEAALKHLLDAQLDDPDNPQLLYNLGNTYYRLGDFEAAQRHYEQALETKDSQLKQQSLYNLGNAHFRRQDLESAIQNYKEALELNPEDVEAQENLEFAKQLMEQQPPQQQGQQGQESDKENSEESEQQQSEQPSQSPEQREENQASGERPSQQNQQNQYGKEMPPDQEQHRQPQPEPSGEQGEQKSAMQAKAGKQQTPDKEAVKQAQRILNRLEDKPGRALMVPDYRQRRVEKDW